MDSASPLWRIGVLAWIAGTVDAFAYLLLGRIFVSHMTGNAGVLAISLAERRFGEALHRARDSALLRRRGVRRRARRVWRRTAAHAPGVSAGSRAAAALRRHCLGRRGRAERGPHRERGCAAPGVRRDGDSERRADASVGPRHAHDAHHRAAHRPGGGSRAVDAPAPAAVPAVPRCSDARRRALAASPPVCSPAASATSSCRWRRRSPLPRCSQVWRGHTTSRSRVRDRTPAKRPEWRLHVIVSTARTRRLEMDSDASCAQKGHNECG